MSLFSKNLKYLRESKNLSQNKLAELANVNQTTIARWEKDEISPSLDNILDVANVLNISVADITGKDLAIDNNRAFDKLDILYSKSKDIMSEETKATLEFIMQKTIDNYEKSKINNIE